MLVLLKHTNHNRTGDANMKQCECGGVMKHDINNPVWVCFNCGAELPRQVRQTKKQVHEHMLFESANYIKYLYSMDIPGIQRELKAHGFKHDYAFACGLVHYAQFKTNR